MSNTRRAKPGTPLRQNRFASSPEHQSGLLANLVSKRCEVSESAEDRELIWMLQFHSWQKGGLKKLADDLLAQFGDHLGTKSMRRFGVKPVASYNREQVATIRGELGADFRGQFILRGEVGIDHTAADWVNEQRTASVFSGRTWDEAINREEVERVKREAAQNPQAYPVAEFQSVCANAAQRQLSDDLSRVCLDPAFDFESIWYFSELKECLKLRQAAVADRFAHTALSRAIWNEIEDVHQMGGTVLLHNSTGNGKSDAAKACCETYAGRARYVLTPSSNDEVSFLRDIAKSIGCASGLSYKAVQIRERILQTLLSGDLVLVLDSAQFLFPVTDYRYALPNRLNWILTALSEQDVPVVMIGDSKMFDALGLVEARTGWNRSKLVNQLSRVVELPATLEKADVLNIAKAILPDGNKAAQSKLADYMIVAPGYLHSGQPAALRARRIAATEQREIVTLSDMEAALETFMKPSFKALSDGLKRADSAASKCKAKVRNWRPDTDAQIAAKSNRRRNAIVTSSDLKPGADEAAQESPRRHDFSSPAVPRRASQPLLGSERQAPDLVPA